MVDKNTKIIAVLLVVGIIFLVSFIILSIPKDVIYNSSGDLINFKSDSELASFLKQARENANQYDEGRGFFTTERALSPSITSSSQEFSKSTDYYSKTNIQVAGVDEPDIVKTDGEYVYTISYEGNLTIIEAYPADKMKILSITNLNGSANKIFINEDKLIVFGQENYNYPLYRENSDSRIVGSQAIGSTGHLYYYNPRSFVKIYDISDRSNPELEKSLIYEGSYYDSRMIDSNIYLIAIQQVDIKDNRIIYPKITYNEKSIVVYPTDIYYLGTPDYNYQLTTVFAIDLDSSSEPIKKSFLAGYTQTIYVSKSNIYLTSQKYIDYMQKYSLIIEKALMQVVDAETRKKMQDVLEDSEITNSKIEKIQEIYWDYYNGLSENKKRELSELYQKKIYELEAEIAKKYSKTIISKIAIDRNSIKYVGRGEVPGYILNQFSMDEFNGNFRIATTTGQVWDGSSLNNVYVLDKDMKLIGSLEDLARSERIYSTRFIGERLYMVTFKNTDPLFVIDLSNPENPRVLGELKIPGYSNYLHPYDENHIIGIGKEAVESEQNENFAWYQGVKIALFDVSDVSSPKEISKFEIGDRGTESLALSEHKAFLFDKEKELLVIPISLREIDKSKYVGQPPASAYGELTFEGAFVFSINTEDGIKQRGAITHLNESEQKQLIESKNKYYYPTYQKQIQRSFYIRDVLYTLSPVNLKVNDLDSLNEINKVDLPVQRYQDYRILF